MSKQAKNKELVQIRLTGSKLANQLFKINKYMDSDSGQCRDSIPEVSVVTQIPLNFSIFSPWHQFRLIQTGFFAENLLCQYKPSVSQLLLLLRINKVYYIVKLVDTCYYTKF